YVLAPQELAERNALIQRLQRLRETSDPIDDPSLEGQRLEDIEKAQQRLAELDRKVRNAEGNQAPARSLPWIALWDILVFFGGLLVGFAYLWKRGDLKWVKAVTSDTAKPLQRIQQSAQPVSTSS